MTSFDENFPSISNVLNYKQFNLPTFKEYTIGNFTCFDIITILPNKKRLHEKWLVYIPTWETKRHLISYNQKFKRATFKKVI